MVQLATDATIGVTNVSQAIQRRIVNAPILPQTPIQRMLNGAFGWVYGGVRGITKLCAFGADKTLSGLQMVAKDRGLPFKRKEMLISALNGVCGDYLERRKNKFTLPMHFKHHGKPLEMDPLKMEQVYPAAKGKILLFIHGLCMDDVQWERDGHDHGAILCNELDYSRVYLQYNTGRHISTNGQNLSEILDELVQNWPVAVDEINIVAHSMGGLVSRSAFHYATKDGRRWTQLLKRIFFLGSPHHGAPLERAGNQIDLFLKSLPVIKPIADIAKIRSSGITDLRYGNLLDEDWVGKDRFEKDIDDRLPVPLPNTVDCFAIAGTMGDEQRDLKDRFLGDGLVYVESALGIHEDPAKNLKFQDDRKFTIYECNHMELLNHSEVLDIIRNALSIKQLAAANN